MKKIAATNDKKKISAKTIYINNVVQLKIKSDRQNSSTFEKPYYFSFFLLFSFFLKSIC